MVGELIVQDGGDEISSIMISGGPLGAPIVTGRWKRISRELSIHQPCSVVGAYVARHSGVEIYDNLGPLPVAALGRASIGYDGTMALSATAMVAGNPMLFTLADGMWEEGELACTGTATGTIMAGSMPVGQVEDWFVVLDGGNELWGIGVGRSNSNPVTLWTVKRISRQPPDLD